MAVGFRGCTAGIGDDPDGVGSCAGLLLHTEDQSDGFGGDDPGFVLVALGDPFLCATVCVAGGRGSVFARGARSDEVGVELDADVAGFVDDRVGIHGGQLGLGLQCRLWVRGGSGDLGHWDLDAGVVRVGVVANVDRGGVWSGHDRVA